MNVIAQRSISTATLAPSSTTVRAITVGRLLATALVLHVALSWSAASNAQRLDATLTEPVPGDVVIDDSAYQYTYNQNLTRLVPLPGEDLVPQLPLIPIAYSPWDFVSDAPLRRARMLETDIRCLNLRDARTILAEFHAAMERRDWRAAIALLDEFQRGLSCANTAEAFRLNRELASALGLAAKQVNEALPNQVPLACGTFNSLINPGLLVDDQTACQGGRDFYSKIREPAVRQAGQTCATHYPSNQMGLWGYDLYKGALVGSSLLRSASGNSVTPVIDAFWARFPEPVNRGHCCSLPEMMADGFICGRGVRSCDGDAPSEGPAGSSVETGSIGLLSSVGGTFTSSPATTAFGTTPEQIAANFCASRGGGGSDGLGNGGGGALALSFGQCLATAMGNPMQTFEGQILDAAPGMRCLPGFGPPLTSTELWQAAQGVLDPTCGSPLAKDGNGTWNSDKERRLRAEDKHTMQDSLRVAGIADFVRQEAKTRAAANLPEEFGLAVVPDTTAKELCSNDTGVCNVPPITKDGRPTIILPESVANGGDAVDKNGNTASSTTAIIHEILHVLADLLGSTNHRSNNSPEHHDLTKKAEQGAKTCLQKGCDPLVGGAATGTSSKDPDPESAPLGSLGCSATANKIRQVASCVSDAFESAAGSNPMTDPRDPTPWINPDPNGWEMSPAQACTGFSPSLESQCDAIVQCADETTGCCRSNTLEGGATIRPYLYNCEMTEDGVEVCVGPPSTVFDSYAPSVGGTLPHNPLVNPVVSPTVSPESIVVSPVETSVLSPAETPVLSPEQTPVLSPVETSGLSPVVSPSLAPTTPLAPVRIESPTNRYGGSTPDRTSPIGVAPRP